MIISDRTVELWTAGQTPVMRPAPGTCDWWGGCDKPAISRRRCQCCGYVLPVCAEHLEADR